MKPSDEQLLATIAKVRRDTRSIAVIEICDRCAELIAAKNQPAPDQIPVDPPVKPKNKAKVKNKPPVNSTRG